MGAISTRSITIGSRPSQLARWQSDHILDQLQKTWPGLSCSLVTLVTTGDTILDRPLPEIGGKGVFTAELETALRSGKIDLAVHSLKDLPVDDAEGLCIGAVAERACAQDVLIASEGLTLEGLPLEARVGTSSLRRESQLHAARSDLTILPLRGNVDTRIRKMLQGQYDAIVLAAAGVERLGLADHIRQYLPFEVMLPAPGQGALAIQCRADDTQLLELLQPLHHAPTAQAVRAERAFLAGLGGGCSAPIAAYAAVNESGLRLRGLVANIAGRQVVRVSGTGSDPVELGQRLARTALDQGAGALL